MRSPRTSIRLASRFSISARRSLRHLCHHRPGQFKKAKLIADQRQSSQERRYGTLNPAPGNLHKLFQSTQGHCEFIAEFNGPVAFCPARPKLSSDNELMEFQRSSGVLLHISSLASYGGIGDLGPEAYAFLEFLAAAKQHVWQVLPLSPTGYGKLPLRG
jgi:hypothetical protein